MASLYILIPIAVVFIAVALWVFLWSVFSGQFDDLESPAHRILFDEKEGKISRTSSEEKTAVAESGKSGEQKGGSGRT